MWYNCLEKTYGVTVHSVGWRHLPVNISSAAPPNTEHYSLSMEFRRRPWRWNLRSYTLEPLLPPSVIHLKSTLFRHQTSCRRKRNSDGKSKDSFMLTSLCTWRWYPVRSWSWRIHAPYPYAFPIWCRRTVLVSRWHWSSSASSLLSHLRFSSISSKRRPPFTEVNQPDLACRSTESPNWKNL